MLAYNFIDLWHCWILILYLFNYFNYKILQEYK